MNGGANVTEDRTPQLVLPMLIDGEAYSDRDRQMFVAGFEYHQIADYLERYPGLPLRRPVHSENEDRIRLLCSRMRRRLSLTRLCRTWLELEVGGDHAEYTNLQ